MLYRNEGILEEEISESEFVQEYTKGCGLILKQERKKRHIPQDRLAAGILSRAALAQLEAGKCAWVKVTGDILMHRMGIPADNFEIVAASEEMDRWRLREDICLLVLDDCSLARQKVEEYRSRYEKREPIEEQFLLRQEALLMLVQARGTPQAERGSAVQAGQHSLGEEILEKALAAVACTLRGDWEKELEGLLLSPAELETVLTAAAARMVCGQREKAWELMLAVWEYPGKHQWEERMQALILPQAALLGLKLALGEGDCCTALRFGREGVELLRRNCSQRYALLLLEAMGKLTADNREDEEYLRQAAGFCDAFLQLYEMTGCPGRRLWQSLTVDNTRDVGIVLRMLRNFAGKPRSKSVFDEEGQIITERQLEKIENGTHKPSYQNYLRLLKQYRKYEDWKSALMETDSKEVLELRQNISTMIGFAKWNEAEWELKKLRKRVDARYPKVRQELLRFEALIQWKKNGNAMEKSLEMLLEALHCTVPGWTDKDMRYWVFQRGEIMIASNIATLYRKLGLMEESGKWFRTVLFSLEKQCARSGIMHNGYDILMDSYDNLLGDMKLFEEAIEMNQEAIENILKWSRIRCVPTFLYRIAWNSFELVGENPAKCENYHSTGKKAFGLSEVFSDFIYDSNLKSFLDKRRKKFLG